MYAHHTYPCTHVRRVHGHAEVIEHAISPRRDGVTVLLRFVPCLATAGEHENLYIDKPRLILTGQHNRLDNL